MRRLREEISEKRLAIYTVTKGIPFNRLEVRPEDQIPQNSFEKLLSSPSKKPSLAVPLPYMQGRKTRFFFSYCISNFGLPETTHS